KAGETRITGSSSINVDTAHVTVKDIVAKVTISPAGLTLNVGSSAPFTCTLVLNEVVASNAQFDWSSGNTAIATVSTVGLVSGVSPGNTVVQCFNAQYRAAASGPVGVIGGDYNITFKPGSVAVNKGRSTTV